MPSNASLRGDPPTSVDRRASIRWRKGSSAVMSVLAFKAVWKHAPIP
jgi:hypothetical protein